MGEGAFHPKPAAGVDPRQPLPPPYEAAFWKAEAIGRQYGKFDVDVEQSFFLMFETPGMGGIVLWDRLNEDERRKHLANVQIEYGKLPKLPPAQDLAMAKVVREGFLSGSGAGYEVRRFHFKAVWVAAELAKAAIVARASSPSISTIGNAFTARYSDCAAQTAARVIQEMNGTSVSAQYLLRAFGLPRTSIQGYEAAVAYALNWFEGLGLKLAPKAGGFRPGGDVGKYVIFMKGGSSGGHVIYGEVTSSGVHVVDNQLGSAWSSLEAAQAGLGMKATAAYRVLEAPQVP